MDESVLLAGKPLSSYMQFPDKEDWYGWIDILTPEDTGNIDCVAPCLQELLCYLKGEALREMEYHEKFSEHRLEGEWFAPHPDILAEIERLKGTKT